jgi:hypothetical protein
LLRKVSIPPSRGMLRNWGRNHQGSSMRQRSPACPEEGRLNTSRRNTSRRSRSRTDHRTNRCGWGGQRQPRGLRRDISRTRLQAKLTIAYRLKAWHLPVNLAREKLAALRALFLSQLVADAAGGFDNNPRAGISKRLAGARDDGLDGISGHLSTEL